MAAIEPIAEASQGQESASTGEIDNLAEGLPSEFTFLSPLEPRDSRHEEILKKIAAARKVVEMHQVSVPESLREERQFYVHILEFLGPQMHRQATFASRSLDANRAAVEASVQYAVAQSNLELQFSRDHLTGLWNRRSLENKLLQLEAWRSRLPADQREDVVLVLQYLDIDHFKDFNSRYGHPGGDAMLRTCSKALSRHSRDFSDFVGRHGGEEFGKIMALSRKALLENTTPEERRPHEEAVSDDVIVARVVRRIAESYRQRVVQDIQNVDVGNGKIASATCSMGVTFIDDIQPGEDQDNYLKRTFGTASALLNVAKNRGRNQTVSSLDLGPTPHLEHLPSTHTTEP